jgi:hypothetical protein
MTLTLGLLRLANAVPALVAAIPDRARQSGWVRWSGPSQRRSPRRCWSKRPSHWAWPRPLSPCGEQVGLGATLAAVTGRRDRQLTSKQAS